ncbi:MAG: PD-(D/E)XK nuclease family protein, partial [Ignavibacteria bacterium]|nr:PD-(D/E)XK nuclease family protein [Ignavibacteria bacterium]
KQETKTYYEFEKSEPGEYFQNEFEQNNRLKSVLSAETKGKLIHSILEKDLSVEAIEPFLQKFFKAQRLDYLPEQIEDFKSIIINELTNYYSSEAYRTLRLAENQQNEFQVYLKEKDFYLFGIVDKVIFTEETLTIVDYKTDNVPVEELPARAKDYFLQLTFYAFILIRLFPDKKEILLRIIFIKFPDENFSLKVEDNELVQLEAFVVDMTEKIRKKDFSKSLHHCRQCHFADSRNNCIF